MKDLFNTNLDPRKVMDKRKELQESLNKDKMVRKVAEDDERLYHEEDVCDLFLDHTELESVEIGNILDKDTEWVLNR